MWQHYKTMFMCPIAIGYLMYVSVHIPSVILGALICFFYRKYGMYRLEYHVGYSLLCNADDESTEAVPREGTSDRGAHVFVLVPRLFTDEQVHEYAYRQHAAQRFEGTRIFIWKEPLAVISAKIAEWAHETVGMAQNFAAKFDQRNPVPNECEAQLDRETTEQQKKQY